MAQLQVPQVLRLARVIATSFAQREPMARHVRPPQHPPAALRGAWHTDPFGSEQFGPWTTEQIMYWLIRGLVLTDPASPAHAIQVHDDALRHSLAITDGAGQVLGGVLNETMPPLAGHTAHRQGDPFLTAVDAFAGPLLGLLAAQSREALAALCDQYAAFQRAYAQGRVGHLFMVARCAELPAADAFELVAASAEQLLRLGHEYMVTEATNQWTGAASELLGGVRVHFVPFRVRQQVPCSAAPIAGTATSPDGYLSDKDSGSMFYVLRLH